MRLRLYVIEEGNQAMPEFRCLEEMQATPDDAVAMVEDRFRLLLLNEPRIGNVFVLSSLGEPPGSIIAAELLSPLPKVPRQLRWLADKSTGLRLP
jgi:hypothetical protein